MRNRFVGKHHNQEIKPLIRRFLNRVFQRRDSSTREWDSDEYGKKIARISRTRIAILFIALQLGFGLLIGRLVLVQLLHSDELSRRSEGERQIQIPESCREVESSTVITIYLRSIWISFQCGQIRDSSTLMPTRFPPGLLP